MYYFQTNQMTVGYDGNPLIRDITINVEKGEIVTLIGPNGAGKSTILKSITRQLKTIGGTVTIDQQELSSYSYKALSTKMAVVLTERMKPELMTCSDIVATGRYPYTGRLGILSKADEEKVADAMDKVHALDLAERDFNAISDGQRQRILLARAIAQEPHIIMLDEPTNYLDIHYEIELLNVLRRLVRTRDVAVIMSLHELPLARKVSDYVMCIKGDCVCAQGTADEIFTAEIINELYDLEPGVFDPISGNIRLEDE